MEESLSAAKPLGSPLRGVRVVGKIRALLDSESSSSSIRPRVSMVRDEERGALISFDSSREPCRLDWCYNEDEGADEIFSKEMQLTIHELFEGRNACVIAYGATKSGKTQLLEGFKDDPGLVPVALARILALAEENNSSVKISCFEVVQNHIYDILEPKGQEVLILEDKEKKIQLKGLSQVQVKLVSEFKEMYINGSNNQKSFHKTMPDPPAKYHRGVIIHVNHVGSKTKTPIGSKIIFIDLEGYEESKHNPRFDKSLFSLLNVLKAFNGNEVYIPFRESKLTRLMQDFMCRGGSVLMFTCLSPLSCQDASNACSMASRLCQKVNHSKLSVLCSPATPKACTFEHFGRKGVQCSPVSSKASTVVSFGGKGGKIAGHGSFGKKVGCSTSEKKARNPLLHTSEKKPQYNRIDSNKNKCKTTERKHLHLHSPKLGSPENKGSIVADSDHSKTTEGVDFAADADSNSKVSIMKHSSLSEPDHLQVGNTELSSDVEVSSNVQDESATDQNDQEVQNSHYLQDSQIITTETSPPLSERIKGISNSLKFLSTRPIGTPQSDVEGRKALMDCQEPKTPGISRQLMLNENVIAEDFSSPKDRFKTLSAGLKKSLVHECITFLNSANKESLKQLKGIGEKRASYILELREGEPFKEVDDLKLLGLSTKQITEMISNSLENA